MTKRDLSVSDLCLILETCGKAKVATLKWGDLQVDFSKQTEIPAYNPMSPLIGMPANFGRAHPSTPATEIAETQRKIAANVLSQDEATLREDQIAFLAVENPVALEEMIQNGELDEDAADEEA